MHIKNFFIISIFSISTIQLFGQIKLEAEIRPRTEYRDGYKMLHKKENNPSLLVTQRTRLILTYKNEKIGFKIVPQDVRIWGGEDHINTSGINISNEGIDIHEAWFSFNIRKNSLLKIGRQELNYNDQRLLAKRNWNQNGLAYDMIKFEYNPENCNFHAGLSWNNSSDNLDGNIYPNSRYKTVDFLWFNKELSSGSTISFLGITTGSMQSDTTEKMYFNETLGTFFELNKNKLGFRASGYYQFGKNRFGDLESAYLADLQGLFKINLLEIVSGITYISGNKQNIDSNKDHTFDMLYGARHSFHGMMDYFSNLDKATNHSGLVNGYFSFSIKPHKILNVKLMYHIFSTSGDYFKTYNEFSSLNKYLASECDIVSKLKIADYLNLEFGYGFILPSTTLRKFQMISNHKFSNFAYIMVIANHVLFEE